MNLWSGQHGCFNGDGAHANDNGVLRETYAVGANAAHRYDLGAWGAACEKYSLILVDNGGHVIGGQYQRIWNFLKQYSLP